MKLKLYSILLIGFSAGLISCKTASKMYEKGNYDEAVELAAKKLQKKPDDSKLIDIIRSSYSYAVNDHEQNIRNHSQSTNELKWEWMFNEYAALQKMYEAIYKVPSIMDLVKPMDYSSYLVTYADKAGDVRFDRGMSLMLLGDKQNYRNAYREMQIAIRFKPGNRDIQLKMDEAFDYAVTNVVFLPASEDPGGFRFSSYNSGIHNVEDQLIRSLQYGNSNEFVKFYTPWDVQSRNIRTDMVVDMRMANMHIGHYRDMTSTRKVSKEVVIKERVIRPDSVIKEYGTVYANIITTTRTMASEATLAVDIRDADGNWLWNDRINASHSWNTEFSSFTGDARALSEADKQMINRQAQASPRDEDIIRCLTDEISNDALYRLRAYFNRM
ncbi:MAG: hypothetical protein IPP73_16255 [Chitinophagaceae bacterium]|nr:hypothetical protein [Chitinophagaceae bacterium]